MSDDGTRVAIGIVETNSVPRGILVTDEMVKKAAVHVVESCPLCPGRFLVVVSGRVSDVRSAVERGIEAAGAFIVDSALLPDVHPDVLKAVMRAVPVEGIEALGIVEVHSMASCFEVADLVVKTSEVLLVELRLSRCLGGKSFVSFTGGIASVRAAADAGETLARKRGQLVHSVVIPRVHKELHRFIV